MGWLFVQVWILFVVAFLLGAGVTWLAFVRPQRRGAHAGPPRLPWTPAVPAWASGSGEQHPRPAEPEEPPAPRAPAVDPALAGLDARLAPGPRPPGPGVTATGALDRLGVADTGSAAAVQPGAGAGGTGATRPDEAGRGGAQQGGEGPDIPAQAGPADSGSERRGGGRT